MAFHFGLRWFTAATTVCKSARASFISDQMETCHFNKPSTTALADQVCLFMLMERQRLISVLPITAESRSIRGMAPPSLLPVHVANTGSKEKQLHHESASLSAHNSEPRLRQSGWADVSAGCRSLDRCNNGGEGTGWMFSCVKETFLCSSNFCYCSLPTMSKGLVFRIPMGLFLL